MDIDAILKSQGYVPVNDNFLINSGSPDILQGMAEKLERRVKTREIDNFAIIPVDDPRLNQDQPSRTKCYSLYIKEN